MSILQDKEGMLSAYNNVRHDDTDTNWCCLRYEGNDIVLCDAGEYFGDLLAHFGDDERVFAYLRVETGDEMSVRRKFAFITWIGPAVSPLKKAKVSTDKAFVKQVFTNYSKEILADNKNDITEDKIRDIVNKASGASYGPGK